MSSPPPNPDTRDLPYGWVAQYNWEHYMVLICSYKQWFYVNTREQPPRSSWEHPLGPMPQGFAPPSGPPPDRSYSRSPYGGAPGGYNSGYQPSYGASPQGYGGPPPNYANAPSGGYMGGGPYGSGGSQQGSYPPENRGWFGHGGGGQQQPVYAQAPPKKSGIGLGTAVLAGGAGLVGGALLMDAFEDHDEREREEGYDQGYDQGFDDNQGGFDGGDW
ncbi:hypothetical protein BDN67DRAFT_532713 [Paxillus ammoniavirescens]|nr:hypothetical protein BDN67DRAFT_532713 [Paxillus ammoniavirescens]